MSAFLHFDLGEQHGRSGGRDRNLSRLRAADAVEDIRLIAREQNTVHGGQGCAHDIDAAHQFVGAPVGVNAPDQHRQNLERLRHGALRQRESSLDIFEIKAVGLALFFNFFDQLLAQFGIFDGARGRNDQVALPPGRHQAGLGTAVSVGIGEVLDGHARHQEIFKNAVLDDFDTGRGHALVVVFIPSAEVEAVELALRGIVDHTEKVGQNWLADFLGESLAFLLAALAVAFEAMSEHFVKEDGGGAPGEQGWSGERLGHRSFTQGLQIACHFLDAGANLRFARQMVDAPGLEGFDAHQFHAVIGAGFGLDRDANIGIGSNHAGAFGGEKVQLTFCALITTSDE